MEDFLFMDWALLLGGMFALAAMAGFLAGLLGIGGGLVLVPGLFFVFTSLGFDSPHIMHLAIGTSLSTIMATGLSSAFAHHRRGNVRFDMIKTIGIGMVFGVVIGTSIASIVTGLWLQIFFAVTLVFLAGMMRLNPEKMKKKREMPSQPWPAITGTGIGVISTLMGIGGAALNVPYMTLHNIRIHQAIGSASAMGLFVAVPGALGFIIIGFLSPESSIGFPPFSFGYINLLALGVIIPVTVLFAPLGVRLGHSLSIKKMRQVFSIFMMIIALRMIYEVVRAF